MGDKASLRSDQVVKEGKIGDAMSDEYIEMALRNQSGGGIKTGSTGEKEFVRYDPLPIEGLNWCMITTTAGTVTQIEQIATVINEVDEIVGTIATAVGEQAVTGREITSNVSQTSQGIQEVNENVSQSSTVAGTISGDIADVNHSVQEISSSSGQVNRNAEDLRNSPTAEPSLNEIGSKPWLGNVRRPVAQ